MLCCHPAEFRLCVVLIDKIMQKVVYIQVFGLGRNVNVNVFLDAV